MPQAGATAWLVTPREGEHLARAERGLLEGSSLQALHGEDVVPGILFIGLELVGLTLLFEMVCLGKFIYLRETSGSVSTS